LVDFFSFQVMKMEKHLKIFQIKAMSAIVQKSVHEYKLCAWKGLKDLTTRTDVGVRKLKK